MIARLARWWRGGGEWVYVAHLIGPPKFPVRSAVRETLNSLGLKAFRPYPIRVKCRYVWPRR